MNYILFVYSSLQNPMCTFMFTIHLDLATNFLLSLFFFLRVLLGIDPVLHYA